MPIYQLSKEISFPHPALANEDGILAIGGDLSPERLILAYSNGIFPWFNENEPIIWHAPKERFVLFPENLKLSKSTKQLLKQNPFKITVNQNFEDVITACKEIYRQDQDGTWITPEMKKAYIKLHQLNFATSIEVWENKKLVGGLYGVHFGKVFFGESMFHKVSNASKLALIHLVKNLEIEMIDCQIHSLHLEKLGAKFVHLSEFLEIIKSYK